MTKALKIGLGIVPASSMLVLAMLFADYMSATRAAAVLLFATLGTCGLALALMDYPRRAVVFIITLLVVGIAGTAFYGVWSFVSVFIADANRGQLGGVFMIVMRLAFWSWLLLGPVVVGALEIRRAWEVRAD